MNDQILYRRSEKLIKALGKAVKETRAELGMLRAELKTKDIDLYEKELKRIAYQHILKAVQDFCPEIFSCMERIDKVFKR